MRTCGPCIGIACAVVLTAAMASSVTADVLICASADLARRTDVQTKIAATGLIAGSVDQFDAITNTPSVPLMLSYDAVLVFTNDAPASAVVLGDRLADYLDRGGRVVLCTFGLNDNVFGVAGRFRDGGYAPMSFSGQAQGTPLSLGLVNERGHPIMRGVTALNGGTASFHNVGSEAIGATVLARWSNNRPLVVHHTVNGGSIVALNFYPPSSDVAAGLWDSTTDGAVLMANALNYTDARWAIVAAATNAPAVAASHFADVAAKLAPMAALHGVRASAIAGINATLDTPTLARLQQFEAVLVFSVAEFADAPALGDAMADYVDSGGRVVEAAYAMANGLRRLTGRWEADGYPCLTPGPTATAGAMGLGTVQLAGHPALLEVASVSNGSMGFHVDTSVAAGATEIVQWDNAEPLVAMRSINGGSVIGLNMLPPSSDNMLGAWDATTDGGALMANCMILDASQPQTFCLLASDNNVAGIRTDTYRKLYAQGVRNVSVIDVGGLGRVPALAEIEFFDTVLCYSNNPFLDPVATGDLLADYIDGGGRMVLAMAAWASGLSLSGRFVTGGYAPFNTGQPLIAQPAAALGTVLVPGHSLLTNVTTLSSPSGFRCLLTPDADATIIARWTDNNALIAVQGGLAAGESVGLNFFPASTDSSPGGWSVATDGAQLLANALLLPLGGGPPPADTGCAASPNLDRDSGAAALLMLLALSALVAALVPLVSRRLTRTV